MRSLHLIRAAVAVWALAGPGLASAQQTFAPEPGANALTIFLRGAPVGSEQVTLSRTADGWTISSSGRFSAPIDASARRLEVRYTADWKPREFTLDGTARGVPQTIRTVIEGNQARSVIVTGGQQTEKTDTVDPGAVLVLPSTFFAPFEAVAVRVKTTAAGTEIPAYGVPAIAFAIRIGASSAQQIQTTSRLISATRTAVQMKLPGAAIDADLWTDEGGRMIRFSVPAQQLEVVRDDVASVSSRSVLISRPNDEAIRLPANGFVLAGTMSRPTASSPEPAPAGKTAAARLPAVVLVGASGAADRDGVHFGVPILGQIANALAEAGFLVVRYDKRGIGQSGGRVESAGLNEYAEDVRAVVKALSDRKDVDPKRIAAIGYGDGGAVALLASAKDNRIKAVGLLATPGTTGAEIVLAQQRRMLGRATLPASEQQAAIDLQRRIHEAVISGRGWEQLPISIRRAVDNPEFQTLLLNDPAKVVPNVKQPILIVQGALDSEVDASNADTLETLARARKKSPPVDVVRVPGVNHLLVPATTGEVDEYASLPSKQVSGAVTQALVEWLKKTL